MKGSTQTLDELIGVALYKARKSGGWTQKDIAQALNIEQCAVSRIEAGKQKLTASQAVILGLAMDFNLHTVSI